MPNIGEPGAFVAVDVETANADRASICQFGLAACDGTEITREWKTLVDPEDYFDSLNVGIHGIDERVVKGAPTFEQIASEIAGQLVGRVVVSHTTFDRVSLERAFEDAGLEVPDCTWLDSARVARRTWPDVARRGYGLGPLCCRIGYSYRAHDALEDAKAAAKVLLAAIDDSKLDVNAWVERLAVPARGYHPRVSATGNPDGPLAGEVVVFTGTLSIPRQRAADLAAQFGCDVAPSVSKQTTILVMGDQDARRLDGHDKSTKQMRAEALIASGHQIELLTEKDFARLMAHFVDWAQVTA